MRLVQKVTHLAGRMSEALVLKYRKCALIHKTSADMSDDFFVIVFTCREHLAVYDCFKHKVCRIRESQDYNSGI